MNFGCELERDFSKSSPPKPCRNLVDFRRTFGGKDCFIRYYSEV